MSDGRTREHYPVRCTAARQGGGARTATRRTHHPQLRTTSTTWSSSTRRRPSGMWVFLVTEIMFFGGLFIAYLVYRWASTPTAFPDASAPPRLKLGARSTRSS